MPLHSDRTPPVARLARLDNPIVAPRDGSDATSEPAHRLVMQAVDVDHVEAHDLGGPATRLHAHGVRREALLVGTAVDLAVTSGRCATGVPPAATLMTCAPRQMPSTGRPSSNAPCTSANSHSSRLVLTPSSVGEGGAPYEAGSMSPPPDSSSPSSPASRARASAPSRIGRTSGKPPARVTASK